MEVTLHGPLQFSEETIKVQPIGFVVSEVCLALTSPEALDEFSAVFKFTQYLDVFQFDLKLDNSGEEFKSETYTFPKMTAFITKA